MRPQLWRIEFSLRTYERAEVREMRIEEVRVGGIKGRSKSYRLRCTYQGRATTLASSVDPDEANRALAGTLREFTA
jgi:hypothetical protein